MVKNLRVRAQLEASLRLIQGVAPLENFIALGKCAVSLARKTAIAFSSEFMTARSGIPIAVEVCRGAVLVGAGDDGELLRREVFALGWCAEGAVPRTKLHSWCL